jgi:hypothetical protein
LSGVDRAKIELAKRYRKAVDMYKLQLRAHEQAVKRAMRKQPSEEVLAALVDAQPAAPTSWTLYSNSFSQAGLRKLLTEGGGSTALVAREVGLLFNSELSKAAPDLNSYFSGESNDKALGGMQDKVQMSRPSLALFLLGQRDILDEHEGPLSKYLRGIGFTARALYADCPPFSGLAQAHSGAEQTQALETFEALTYELAIANTELLEESILEFDQAAANLYYQACAEVDAARLPGAAAADIADLLSKAPEIAARLAGLFARTCKTNLITAEHFVPAFDLMRFFLSQGKKRYGNGAIWTQDEDNIQAAYKHLYKWCADHQGASLYPWGKWLQLATPEALRNTKVREFVLDHFQKKGMLAVVSVGNSLKVWLSPAYFPVRQVVWTSPHPAGGQKHGWRAEPQPQPQPQFQPQAQVLAHTNGQNVPPQNEMRRKMNELREHLERAALKALTE